MEPADDWYQDIEKKISSLKDNLTKKDYQSYQLDYLKRVAKKVADLSPKCNECHKIQVTITEMVTSVEDSPQMAIEKKKDYLETFRVVISHLEGHAIAEQKWTPEATLIIVGSLSLVAGAILFGISFSLGNGAGNAPTQFLFSLIGIPLLVIGISFLLITAIRLFIRFLRSKKDKQAY